MAVVGTSMGQVLVFNLEEEVQQHLTHRFDGDEDDAITCVEVQQKLVDSVRIFFGSASGCVRMFDMAVRARTHAALLRCARIAQHVARRYLLAVGATGAGACAQKSAEFVFRHRVRVHRTKDIKISCLKVVSDQFLVTASFDWEVRAWDIQVRAPLL